MGNIQLRGKKVYMDGYLQSNLNEIIDMIRLNFDGVLLVDGMEGSGKSELGLQLCLYVDKKFNEQNVIYTVNDFIRWIDTAKPGSACLWDEFVLAGLSTDALTQMQTILIKKFTIIRKKNLFIVLVIPYIFMLRKYFAVARTRALIHVYTKGKNRGFFRFYNYSEKTWIYNYGYKTWIYSEKIKPSFYATFTVWSEKYLDHSVIESKKDNAMKQIEEDQYKVILTKAQEDVLLHTPNPFHWKDEGTKYKTFERLVKKIDQTLDNRNNLI